MANTIVVAQQMWQRRDTAAAWTAANPVLHAGEIGVEVGGAVVKFKIGDGMRAWNALPYEGGGAGWLRGSGVPAVGLGADGNFYLNDSNADVYAKSAGAWAKVGSLAGGGGSGGGVSQIIAGANVSVDSTDPTKPVVSASGTMGPVGPAGPEGPRGGAIISGTVALGHFDGVNGSTSDTDPASGGLWVFSNGAKIDTSQSKFGGASLSLNAPSAMGSTSLPSASFRVDGGFTLELWVRRNGSARHAIWGQYGSPSEGWYCGIYENGAVYAGLAVGSYQVLSTAAGDVPPGSWAHVAYVRDGARFKIFVNGVKKTDAAIGGELRTSASTPTLGRESNSSPLDRTFQGHMDELRWSSVARYSADFTPQTLPFATPVAPQLPVYTVASLPPVAFNAYVMVFVTDLAGGAEPCVSDGASWRRLSDRSVVA